MNQLEQKALRLLQSGMSRDDVETKLGYEFMVYRDSLTGEIHHVSQWKPKCKSCFNA
uniref:Uncharacterized protein n=1 Tax=viral metagenome TaxID=1070528 RepID=A0A6H1ZU77_9ZZZZ